jgi:formylglycine-generating enzyme required for sulfatase activity
MIDQEMQHRALQRQRRRMVELKRRIQVEGAACPPGVLEEHDELRLLVAMLEANLPAEDIAEPSSQAAVELAQRIVWTADGKHMVLVPAGTFVLGTDQSYRGDNRPAHEVYLPAYYIDVTPVTIAEYGRFIAATGHAKPKIIYPNGWPHDYERHPVTGVSWHDARAYAAWAGKRLPSEAEWEKAASWDSASATKRLYPWGDQWDARFCNMAHSGPGQTTPVGMFSPYGDAPCGAVDMAGNVAEWTSSLAWNYPCRPGDGRDDAERYGLRVRRGGSYLSDELYVSTVTRCATQTDGWFFTEGFRCVADPSQA